MKPIILNLDTNIDTREYIEMMQGYDYTLECNIFSEGASLDLSAYAVSVEMVQGNKKAFIVQTENITIEGNKATVVLDKDFTNSFGDGGLQIVLTQNGRVNGSWLINCRIKISALARSTDTQSKVDIDASLRDAITEAIEVKNQTENLIATGGAATKGDIAKVNSQLEHKAKQIKNIDLYNNAINDMQLIKNINFTELALENRKLRIAIVGDSITEGANNYKNDTYVDILVNKIKKILPNDVVFEYTNFALSGRGVSNLISEQVAHNPETPWSDNGYFVDFWREWSVEGKTWKDHIRDYKPDLIILAFGMNDSYIDNCGKALVDNLQTFISYIKSTNYYTDFALVTTHLCSESLGIKNNNILCNNTVREFAYNNNYVLLDAGRLSHILRDGVDDCRYTTQEILDKNAISGLRCKNFEINLNVNKWVTDTSENDIIFRDVMRFRFALKNNEKHIYLFSEGNLLMDYVVSTDAINIKVFDSSISVNNYEIKFYDYIQIGNMDIEKIKNNITLSQFIQKIELSNSPIYTEKDLLGDIPYNENIGSTGNAINHPTALGHYLQYVASFYSILTSISKALNSKKIKYDFFESNWGYYNVNSSGVQIIYNTNNGTRLVKKENSIKIYDYTNGLVFKRRTDLKISQVSELKENEFLVFNSNDDTQENATNIFICKTYDSGNAKQLHISVS